MDELESSSFKDSIIWQKAHQFVLAIYHYSDYFPQKEISGLTSQFRRAAISIPANIAEGFKKKSGIDKARLMNIAQGSIEECRYYLILAKDLGYGDNPELMPQLEEISNLLEKCIAALPASGS
jgi:four helix bundle protein